MKTESELQAEGFTDSGRSRYFSVTEGYSEEVLRKSVSYGEVDKEPGLPREVTHEHVRAAAHAIAASYGSPQKSRRSILLQILEYICTALVGVGGGHVHEGVAWAVILFVLSGIIGIAAFVCRIVNESKA